MGLIRWIHLSDLHYNKVGTQTDAMREHLPKYLEDLAEENRIDYIFFTGDMRFAPDKEFPQGIVGYFDQLRDAVHLPKEHLFVVAGNHDVDRNNKKRLAAIAQLEKDYFEKDSVIDANLIKQLKSGRKKYYTILRQVIADEQYLKHTDSGKLHFTITTDNLNLVHLDSALMYTKNKEKDFFLGTYALKQALKECKNEKPTIILSHYSLDFFDPTEQKAILLVLKDHNVKLWLAGHKHIDIIYKDRDFFYVAHSGNHNFEKLTSPGIVEGCLDTDTGSGYFRVHKWNESKDWAVYQTLIDRTDRKNNKECLDRTKYVFDLNDYPQENRISASKEDLAFDKVTDFLKSYTGKSFFVDTILSTLEIDKGTLIQVLNQLNDLGTIKPINYDKTHWEMQN